MCFGFGSQGFEESSDTLDSECYRFVGRLPSCRIEVVLGLFAGRSYLEVLKEGLLRIHIGGDWLSHTTKTSRRMR